MYQALLVFAALIPLAGYTPAPVTQLRPTYFAPERGVGAWLLIPVHHGGESPDLESPAVTYPKRSQYKYATAGREST